MATTIKLGQNGRVVIPADIRRILDLKAGDELLVTLEDKRLMLETEGALLERLYQAVSEPPRGRTGQRGTLARTPGRG